MLSELCLAIVFKMLKLYTRTYTLGEVSPIKA